MAELSRISKLLVDREGMSAADALARRQSFGVVIVCGDDAAYTRTLQLAVLTAVTVAKRCFPSAVRVALSQRAAAAPAIVWPGLHSSFGDALAQEVGPDALIDPHQPPDGRRAIVFGDAAVSPGALRATFDGWIASVGPPRMAPRLPERPYCALAGVMAATLAVCELFLSFAEINVEAGRRRVAISLWEPAGDFGGVSALGPPVEFLPKALWLLGLGHLGNANLWAIAGLPYEQPQDVEIFLNDFDRIGEENIDTGVLLSRNDVGRFKTRVCAEWLETRGFTTRIVERRFDERFRCRADEPPLALCGFDSNPARRHLATASFARVIETGLGGDVHNFETIGLHTLPNPRRAEDLWPDLSERDRAAREARVERTARESAAYERLAETECGRLELAGQSIAVPFVGVGAACLAVADTLRVLHGGIAYTDLKLPLGAVGEICGRSEGTYTALDLGSVPSTSVQRS